MFAIDSILPMRQAQAWQLLGGRQLPRLGTWAGISPTDPSLGGACQGANLVHMVQMLQARSVHGHYILQYVHVNLSPKLQALHFTGCKLKHSFVLEICMQPQSVMQPSES